MKECPVSVQLFEISNFDFCAVSQPGKNLLNKFYWMSTPFVDAVVSMQLCCHLAFFALKQITFST